MKPLCAMRGSRWLFLLAAVVTTADTAIGQPDSMVEGQAGKLEWRFKENDRFQVETQATVQQHRRVVGLPEFRDVVHVNTVSSFHIRKVEEDGTVVFEQKVEKTQIRFDGNNRLAAAAMADLYTKLQGHQFRITLSPERRVVRFEGYDEMIQKLSALMPADQVARFRSFVTEESLRAATEEGFGFLPDKPVKVGDSWSRSLQLPLAGLGSAKAILTYQVESMDRDGKVKLKATTEGSEFEASIAAGKNKPDFTIDERTGTLVFDLKRGRLVSSEVNLKLRGNLLIPNPAGGLGVVPLEIVQQNQAKIVVRDRRGR